MELILVRHGEPLSEERHDGSAADPPLSEAGIEQSKAVAKWLCERPPDCVLSSPALRARQTALPTATRLGLSVEIDERLRDAHSNLPRYVTHEEERARDVDGYRSRMASYRTDGNMLDVSDRVNESIDEWTAANPGRRIVIFCHGSVVNVYAARVLGLATPVFLAADYASAHRFLISRKAERSVKSLNETAYLP